uniref:Methyltransferase 21C, AARS1 lysine n=1 Tax=Seriola dumerili TaxID=41447 RepID=A0A3B4TQU7_SERDU
VLRCMGDSFRPSRGPEQPESQPEQEHHWPMQTHSPGGSSVLGLRPGGHLPYIYVYHYVGQDIVIYESIDSYGAVMWPAALALCSFLDNNRDEVNLQGKEVLELGAGTGLVTIVASLLGASVTSTDLPEVLSNLRANVMRNTRKHCRHTPQVEVLSWGYDLERTHPTSIYRYDYILAADVVYHHDFLDELLATMKHFCLPGTTVIWANKVRMENDLTFTGNFKKAFHTSLLAEDGDMKIFMGTCRH